MTYPEAEFKKWSGRENTEHIFKDPGHDDMVVDRAEIRKADLAETSAVRLSTVRAILRIWDEDK
jgi:hypothetical protein